MLATVDALLPLSLLEAVRYVDTPEGVLEAEFVDELRNKRFGLSDTVYTQIKRYTEAVRRNQRTAQEEAVALAKLIGRRPDAEAVLRAAGRFLAREAYMTVSPVTRGMLHVMPSLEVVMAPLCPTATISVGETTKSLRSATPLGTSVQLFPSIE